MSHGIADTLSVALHVFAAVICMLAGIVCPRGRIHIIAIVVIAIGILIAAPMVLIGGWGNPGNLSLGMFHWLSLLGGIGMNCALAGAALFVAADAWGLWKERRKLIPVRRQKKQG